MLIFRWVMLDENKGCVKEMVFKLGLRDVHVLFHQAYLDEGLKLTSCACAPRDNVLGVTLLASWKEHASKQAIMFQIRPLAAKASAPAHPRGSFRTTALLG